MSHRGSSPPGPPIFFNQLAGAFAIPVSFLYLFYLRFLPVFSMHFRTVVRCHCGDALAPCIASEGFLLPEKDGLLFLVVKWGSPYRPRDGALALLYAILAVDASSHKSKIAMIGCHWGSR